jgi:pyruvate-ferredoxin/flavodoxin oxidoreductase
MNCRGTGYAMVVSNSPQEAMDLAAVCHLASIKARMPFMHFFDGFRKSHEIQNVEMLEFSDLEALADKEAIAAFKQGSLSPNHPTLRNTVQSPDVYFQSREAANVHYDNLPDTIEYYMGKINEITGRDYKAFNYYGAEDADRVIIAMGSVCGTIMETIDALAQRGEKVGLVQVRLFRPFPADKFVAAVPKTAKYVTVLDRTKESGSIGEPLFQDVCTAFAGEDVSPRIFAGRYGLSSKDTDPGQIKAVFDNMKAAEDGAAKKMFTIGITDDLTGLSLETDLGFAIDDKGIISCKFWGLGSDGTVGANKNSIKIIGEGTDLNVQAYFEYDTKKSFGITKSHLRFGKNPFARHISSRRRTSSPATTKSI